MFSQPSIAPVPNPSCYPTGCPTKFNANTGKPTIKGETYRPTSIPTLSPIRDYSEYSNITLFDVYSAKTKANKPNVIVYSSFIYKDKDMTSFDKCESWQYFTENSLLLPFNYVQISSINLFVANEDLVTKSIDEINITCSDLNAVSYIVSKISSGQEFLVSCANHFWRQMRCSGK